MPSVIRSPKLTYIGLYGQLYATHPEVEGLFLVRAKANFKIPTGIQHRYDSYCPECLYNEGDRYTKCVHPLKQTRAGECNNSHTLYVEKNN